MESILVDLIFAVLFAQLFAFCGAFSEIRDALNRIADALQERNDTKDGV